MGSTQKEHSEEGVPQGPPVVGENRLTGGEGNSSSPGCGRVFRRFFVHPPLFGSVVYDHFIHPGHLRVNSVKVET